MSRANDRKDSAGEHLVGFVDTTAVEKARGDLHLLETFGVLGRKITALTPERFLFFLVSDWPTPSFSPLLLLPGSKLDREDLEQLVELYSSIRCANSNVKDTPYVTFIKGRSLYDISGIESTLAAAGWHKEEKPLAVKIFSGGSNLSLPVGHEADVTEFAGSDFPTPYLDLLQSGFAADEAYVSYIRSTFSGSNARTRIVTIRSAAGSVVAGGAVSVRDGMGFLTWGTVAPEWRDKGYHTVLLNYCLGTAASAGAEITALTTRNDRVRGRCDTLLELFICRK